MSRFGYSTSEQTDTTEEFLSIEVRDLYPPESAVCREVCCLPAEFAYLDTETVSTRKYSSCLDLRSDRLQHLDMSFHSGLVAGSTSKRESFSYLTVTRGLIYYD